MANHLDLEEQEQIDQLKHFWKQYGNGITWLLILVLGAVGGWNAYQQWQRSQAVQSSAMYDEVERAAKVGDMAKLDRVFGDIKEKFGSTTYAQQAGLLAAKQYHSAGNVDAAKQALHWVAEKSSDPGYQAIAKLRLAGVLADAKAYDEAMVQLSGSFPANFEALVADRKGDILLLQSKKAEALAEYAKAYQRFDANTQYRRLVEIKMNSLGVDPTRDEKTSGAASVVNGKGAEGKT